MTAEQQGEEIPHVVRLAGERETKFLVETTAKVRQPNGVPWHAWKPIGEGLATKALGEGVAHVIESGGVVLGFIVVRAGVLEMLYVKRDFRGHGFGAELLAAAGLAQPIAVRDSTTSWRVWCRLRGIRWERAQRAEGTASPIARAS